MTQPVLDAWSLDPEVVYLNHGSFGACPRAVLAQQDAIRHEIEREPVRFFVHALEARLDGVRAELGRWLDAPESNLVFVPNATTGVNTVLRSLALRRGDELLTTDHEYNACRNALDAVAATTGARVVAATVPFPIASEEEVVSTLLGCVTNRTRLALVDHVTSPTALVLPIERIVRELSARGVDTLVDGAHAPGMLPLSMRSIGAAYYTGNCHKWLCTPRGAAFLCVREEHQAHVRPLVISHGANSPRTDRSRFQLEFDWTGTFDPSAILCIPHAIRFMGSLLPGGFPELMASNHAKVLRARDVLLRELDVPAPCPESMIGSMAAVPLPPAPSAAGPGGEVELEERLFREHRIEVPVNPWPDANSRLVRISAQLYNTDAQYEQLAKSLRELLARERSSSQ